MSEYRDYISLEDETLIDIANRVKDMLGESTDSSSTLIPTRKGFTTTTEGTQVYQATHRSNNERLPIIDRSFISFSYGGLWIEDFGLIVTIDGDRIERGIYANFQDLVSESEVLDQRFFWATHLQGTDLELTLSTDEMTEKQLSDFKYWFKPGVARELILTEHSNRAIMARIGAVPQLHMLPFEKLITTKIGKRPYHTSTTVYKGDITITFTFDDPLWYSIKNCIEYKNDDDYNNIKIHLEDGIPFDVMLKYPDVYVGDKSKILDKENFYKTLIGEEGDDMVAKVSDDEEPPEGQIGPLLKTSEGDEIFNPAKENSEYFYYCGTAPSKPILQFTLIPTVNDEGYINSPINSFVNSSSPYNTIVFESETKKEFKFTTPSIWTGYNQAIAILKKMDGQPLIDVRRALREGVNHWAPRAYAIVVACTSKQAESPVQPQQNQAEGTGTTETGSEEVGTKTEKLDASKSVSKMKDFLKVKEQSTTPSSTSTSNPNENESPDQENNEQQNNNQNATISSEYYSANFIIDNKTGKVTGEFKFRDKEDEEKNEKEDAGDMIRSNYIIIEDRNYPSEEGIIERWTEDNPQYSHRIYHDVDNGLINFSIDYKNMYY